MVLVVFRTLALFKEGSDRIHRSYSGKGGIGNLDLGDRTSSEARSLPFPCDGFPQDPACVDHHLLWREIFWTTALLELWYRW